MHISPIALVNALARNLVPLAGIVFLGWSATNVLFLYFVDTLLAMAVIFAGLMRHFLPPPRDEGWAARANAEVGYVGGALFLCAFMAIPLGIPMVFMLAGSDVTLKGVFSDSGFLTGLALQGGAALWSGHGLYRALQAHTPEELRLKRQFSLLFLRWLVVMIPSYFGIGLFLGPYAAFFFVAIYSVATFMIDVAPDRFLRAMPGGTEDTDAKGAL